MAIIRVNIDPYKTAGSYYLIPEICKEVGCSYDPGAFNTPITILPESEEQLAQVVELLDLFEMVYNVVNPYQILRDLSTSRLSSN